MGVKNRATRTLALSLGVLAATGVYQSVQAQSTTRAPILSVGNNEETIARRMDLSIGKSIVVDLPRDAKEVFVANPKVANAVVRSTRKIFVIGIENGATSMFVMDANGNQIAALEITVGRDLGMLRQTLRTAMPHANLDVKPAGDSIILTGLVNSAAEATQAADIANAFVGSSGGMFSSSKGGVINSIVIKGKDQVMVRVTVAEVARTVLKQFGINTTGTWSATSLASNNRFPSSSQTFATDGVITAALGGTTGTRADQRL
jgi:pilus assembly protein CpaC